jgi:hypothetical protein
MAPRTNRKNGQQARYESKDAQPRYDMHAKLEHDTKELMRDLNALVESSKISDATRKQMAAYIPAYSKGREERIRPHREKLQERYEEEAYLV